MQHYHFTNIFIYPTLQCNNSYPYIPAQQIASCCLFLAAKVEEQPRKLEHILRISHKIANKSNPDKSELVTHSEVCIHFILLNLNIYI